MTQIMLRDFDHSLCVLFKAIDISVWDTFEGTAKTGPQGIQRFRVRGCTTPNAVPNRIFGGTPPTQPPPHWRSRPPLTAASHRRGPGKAEPRQSIHFPAPALNPVRPKRHWFRS